MNKTCKYCGKQLEENERLCPCCGNKVGIQFTRKESAAYTNNKQPAHYAYSNDTRYPESYIHKSKSVVLLLCFFLGLFGFHRFYVGKIVTGILMLVTFGGLGIWAIIDFILICCGKFTDKQGYPLFKNEKGP